MKRFADSLARQKGIKPPPGYKTSISICRKFLSEHAPKKAEGETPGKLNSKAVSPAQMLYAKKVAQGKGVLIPEKAKANSAAMSAWIHFEPKREAPQARSQDRLQAGRISRASIDGDDEEVSETQTGCLCRSTARAAKFDYRYAAAIPFGNKAVALKLGARYSSGGWYAPPRVDLSAFEERGWL